MRVLLVDASSSNLAILGGLVKAVGAVGMACSDAAEAFREVSVVTPIS